MSADLGLVACLDIKGEWIWRDGLVANIGALSVNQDGSEIVLACFTEGLRRYSRLGKSQGRVPIAEPCRLAALTFDGRVALTADLTSRLHLIDLDGRVFATYVPDRPVASLALAPLGDLAYVALAGGGIVGLDIRRPSR